MRKVTIETIEHETVRDVTPAIEKVLWRMIDGCSMADNTPFVNRFVDLLEFVANHQVVDTHSDLGDFMQMRYVQFETLKSSYNKHVQFKQTIDQVAKIILQENDNFFATTGKVNIQGTKEISGDELYGLIDMIVDSGMIYHLDDMSNLAFRAKEAETVEN